MRVGSSSELWGDRPFVKTMIYGETGSGKTTWAARAPRPLIFLREEQGLATIIHERPDAQVVIIETWADFMEAYTAVKMAAVGTAKNGQPFCTATIGGKTMHFQTLVVDSFTDMQKLMKSHVRGGVDLDKEENISIPQWGRIINVCEAVLSDQRAIPCNTVFIFLASMTQDELGRRKMVPSISGRRLPLEMGQYFNGVGYLTKTSTGERVTLWNADDRFVTKPPCGWPDRTPNTDEPGNVTLGSLMLANQEGSVTHEDYDSAEFVEALDTTNNEEN